MVKKHRANRYEHSEESACSGVEAKPRHGASWRPSLPALQRLLNQLNQQQAETTVRPFNAHVLSESVRDEPGGHRDIDDQKQPVTTPVMAAS